eukprot:Platyproteum_vivax@DN7673_c1_g1_i3.p1
MEGDMEEIYVDEEVYLDWLFRESCKVSSCIVAVDANHLDSNDEDVWLDFATDSSVFSLLTAPIITSELIHYIFAFVYNLPLDNNHLFSIDSVMDRRICY